MLEISIVANRVKNKISNMEKLDRERINCSPVTLSYNGFNKTIKTIAMIMANMNVNTVSVMNCKNNCLLFAPMIFFILTSLILVSARAVERFTELMLAII